MFEDVDEWMAAALALAVPAAFFVGKWATQRTHSIVPFRDPVTIILLAAAFLPMAVRQLWPDALPSNPYSDWCGGLTVAFWLGYVMGYATCPPAREYVAIHDLVGRRETVDYIVTYTTKDGRQCWQPQKFAAICKTLFFRVDNPVSLPRASQRRTVTVHQFCRPQVTVEAVDLIGMEVEKIRVKNRWISWRAEKRTYTPSPRCVQSPYAFYTDASAYARLFEDYAEVEMENSEMKRSLESASIRGAGEILAALGAKNPSSAVMDDLEVRLDETYGEMLRKAKKAAEEAPADAAEGAGDDAGDAGEGGE